MEEARVKEAWIGDAVFALCARLKILRTRAGQKLDAATKARR
jgi:hypothetical protein